MSTPNATTGGDTTGTNNNDNTSNQSEDNTRRPRTGYRGTRPNQRRNGAIPESFKGAIPEVGAVIGTKHENGKESFKKLQDAILQYVMENYTKGRDLMPMIRKMTTIDINNEAPTKPTTTTTGQGVAVIALKSILRRFDPPNQPVFE